MLTDGDGVHCPQGVPPNKVAWRQLARMREDGRRLLPPQFAEILEKAPQPFFQPIFDLLSDAVSVGRIALMGDAAFVARPHIGMGVAKAAEDAVAIADAIRVHGANAAALAAYAKLRLPAGRSAVQRARWLGNYVKSSDGRAQPMAQRQHQAIYEPASDLGRYGHHSTFIENSP